MPSTRRWKVPHWRIALTAILAAIGLFLVFGGIGMGAWLVGGAGIAVLAVGAGIFVLSALNSRATSEIDGTAHVVSASAPPSGVTHGRCRLNLIVHASGMNDTSVKIRDDAVPVAKWPDAGTDLPVMIAIGNPQRTRVIWAEVATHGEYAEEVAHAREAGTRVAATSDRDEYADLGAGAHADAGAPDFDRQPANAPAATFAHAGPGAVVDVIAPVAGAVERPDVNGPDNPVSAERPEVPATVDAERPDVPVTPDEPAMAGSSTRTIEMDVMDPSLMRWSGPPPQRRPAGSRPSPYRRRRVRPVAEPAGSTDASADPITLAGPDSAERIAAPGAPDEPAVAGSAGSGQPDAPAVEGAEQTEPGQSAALAQTAPPEWPPRSAAAVAAAARLPHQWDEDSDEGVVEDVVGDETAIGSVAGSATESAADADAEHATGPGPRLPRDAVFAVSFVGDTPATHDDSGGEHTAATDEPTEPRVPLVPRDRPASEDELFDQEADDGPDYRADTAYAADTEYNPDAGYSSDAGYGEPSHPTDAP